MRVSFSSRVVADRFHQKPSCVAHGLRADPFLNFIEAQAAIIRGLCLALQVVFHDTLMFSRQSSLVRSRATGIQHIRVMNGL